ncbi:DNA polymerase III subunit delta', partial [Streptomyces sp. SID10244]|nr:DNA polymerase III subunit delta' [Streptomyces sp. SID10244]
MTNVFSRLIGQVAVAEELQAAAHAARGVAARLDEGDSAVGNPDDDRFTGRSRAAMTHAWLFTGPPGSGRSVAATCFAAALQCHAEDEVGCGECRACVTAMAQTHADIRHVVPQGLSLSVHEARDV